MGVYNNSPSIVGHSDTGQLPNITGEYFPLNMGFPNGTYGTGALYESGNGTRKHVGQSSNNYNNTKTIGFDASRSKSAYSRSDNIVIPACIWVFYVIKY